MYGVGRVRSREGGERVRRVGMGRSRGGRRWGWDGLSSGRTPRIDMHPAGCLVKFLTFLLNKITTVLEH